MDNALYSIPMGQWVEDKVVSLVLDGPDVGTAMYYEFCVNLFPVVGPAMTADEITGMRRLRHWRPTDDKTPDSFRVYNDDYIERAGGVRVLMDELTGPPFLSETLPTAAAGVPLIGSIAALAGRAYGQRPVLMLTGDALRREAAPANGRVIGHGMHNDVDFLSGCVWRAMSVLSICGTKKLHDAAPQAPDSDGPWWSTHWVDTRGLPADKFDDMQHLTREENSAILQALIATMFKRRALPVGYHILMPTWMLHQSGGFQNNVPPGISALARKPRAFVSHAPFLRKPMGLEPIS